MFWQKKCLQTKNFVVDRSLNDRLEDSAMTFDPNERSNDCLQYNEIVVPSFIRPLG